MAAGQAGHIEEEEILLLQELLKAIGDVTRLRIVSLLFDGEKCVCDIEQQLLISQPLASHHLGVLREAGLVSVRRKGTWSYYSLAKGTIGRLNDLFIQILGKQRFPAEYPSREECETIAQGAD